jgi:hypothetical protein
VTGAARLQWHDLPADFVSLCERVNRRLVLRGRAYSALVERADAHGQTPIEAKATLVWSEVVLAWSERRTPRALGRRWLGDARSGRVVVIPVEALSPARLRDWIVRDACNAARANLLGIPYPPDAADALAADPRRPWGRVDVGAEPADVAALCEIDTDLLDATELPLVTEAELELSRIESIASVQQRLMLRTYREIQATCPEDVDRKLGLTRGQTRQQFARLAKKAARPRRLRACVRCVGLTHRNPHRLETMGLYLTVYEGATPQTAKPLFASTNSEVISSALRVLVERMQPPTHGLPELRAESAVHRAPSFRGVAEGAGALEQ